MNSVEQHEVLELVLHASRPWAKPFVQVRVELECTSPAGRVVRIEGFHDGADVWRVRVALDEVGSWRWRARSEPHDDGLTADGMIDVIDAGDTRGFLQASPGIGFGFRWRDRTPAFLVGDTMYNLFGYAHSGLDPWPLVEHRLAQGMDLIRVRASCSAFHRRPHRHSPWMTADVWPWGGVVQDPDFEQFNLRYFATVDRVVTGCQQRGIALEFILECWLFEFPFVDRRRFTAEDEELWIRYLVARYGAFRSIAIWTPGNEYVYYPDGEAPQSAWRQADTRPDRWLDRIARLVRSLDPHGRPIAAHTMTLPQPTFAERLAGFSAVDTVLFQDWGRRDEFAWTGDGIDGAIHAQLDGARQVAVLAEYGYESIPGLPIIESRKHMFRDHTRRGAWRGAFCGMLVFAGFENTWGPYMQIEPDAPGAADIAHLRRFFLEVARFDRLLPAPGLASGGRDDVPGSAPLAMRSREGDLVTVYLPVGGRLSVPGRDPRRRIAQWFDPRHGSLGNAFRATSDTFEAPGGELPTDDWVLVLRSDE